MTSLRVRNINYFARILAPASLLVLMLALTSCAPSKVAQPESQATAGGRLGVGAGQIVTTFSAGLSVPSAAKTFNPPPPGSVVNEVGFAANNDSCIASLFLSHANKSNVRLPAGARIPDFNGLAADGPWTVVAYNTVASGCPAPCPCPSSLQFVVVYTPPPTGGKLIVTPSSLTFSSPVGQVPPLQLLTLQNQGDTSLSWSAAANDNGLHATPVSGILAGGASSRVQVTADASAVSGTRGAILTIDAGAAGTVRVPVGISSTPICNPPLTLCGGVCVNPQTDPRNCGACGVACPSGACTSGSCCAPPLILCGAGCVNPQTDPGNCGACGVACKSGSCANGTCAPICTPSCDGTTCDDDGCGGVCKCRSPATCQRGWCRCPGRLRNCDGRCLKSCP